MSRPYVVGIDEVGRGPLAGPVCVTSFVLFDYSLLDNPPAPLRDSKKLSEQKRNLWHEYLLKCEKEDKCAFAHAFVDASVIDEIGIAPAIKLALAQSLEKLEKKITKDHAHRTPFTPSEVEVLLDGGLRAPEHFINQKTIIRGDEKEATIALASIVAKVTRDTYMEECSLEYPGYDFHVHKGYGTKMHYMSLAEKGLTPLHRRSFLGSFLNASKSKTKPGLVTAAL